MDLVWTVGESVALGAAGIIFWGDSTWASTNVSIHARDYFCTIILRHMITSVCLSSLRRAASVWISICRVRWADTSSTSPRQPSSAVDSCAVRTGAVCADTRTRTHISTWTLTRTRWWVRGERCTWREIWAQMNRGGWSRTFSVSVTAAIRVRDVMLRILFSSGARDMHLQRCGFTLSPQCYFRC